MLGYFSLTHLCGLETCAERSVCGRTEIQPLPHADGTILLTQNRLTFPS